MDMAGPDRRRVSLRQVTTATPAGLDFRATGVADEGCADTMSTESACSIALVLSQAQASGLDCHPQAPGKSGGVLDECAADLRRPQTTRRLESDPVVPNRSFEKMPEGEMPCEMKRTSDTFERRLPLHIVPQSKEPGAASIWCGGAATGSRRRRSARPRRCG